MQFPEHDLFVFPSCNNTVALFVDPHGHYSTWGKKKPKQVNPNANKSGTQDDGTDLFKIFQDHLIISLGYIDTTYAKKNFSRLLGGSSYSQ